MKKIVLTAAMALMVLVSCVKKEEKETEVVAPESTTDTVVVETPAAPVQEVAPAAEETDGTSVSVGSGGVSVDSKNGTNKTTIDVKEGGAAVEIKK